MAAAFCLILSACAGPAGDKSASASKTSAYLTFLDTEPALADPQRISEKYTVVLNVFDRLAEEKEEDGRNPPLRIPGKYPGTAWSIRSASIPA